MASERQDAKRPSDKGRPGEEHAPGERAQIEHASGFQGDKSRLPVDGDEVADAGGTAGAVPPQTSLPPEEQGRDRTPGPGR